MTMKKFLYNLIAPILTAMLVAGSVNAAFYQWSTTPASNATADPTINWAEGMSPSAVNDSARAMMAALAVNALEKNGSITTGGTSAAYTLATSTNYPSLSAITGQPITFIAHVANDAAAQINIDGTGFSTINIDASTTIPANTLKVGGIYTITRLGSVYRLHNNFNNPFQVPLGTVLWSTISTPPDANYLAADGRCISNITYASYWVAMGSPASGACAGGFFAITDLRGRVPAGLDTMAVVGSAGRLTASATGCGTTMNVVGTVCSNGLESHTLTNAEIPTITSSATQTITVSPSSGFIAVSNNSSMFDLTNPGGSGTRVLNNTSSFSSSQTFNGSNNIAVTSNNTGNGAHTSVQPTIGLMPYIRVL
jgi:hypothetical protein